MPTEDQPENMDCKNKAHRLKRQHTTDSDSDLKTPSHRARMNPAPNLKGRKKGQSSTPVVDTSHDLTVFLLILTTDQNFIMELSLYLFNLLLAMTNLASINSQGLCSSD